MPAPTRFMKFTTQRDLCRLGWDIAVHSYSKRIITVIQGDEVKLGYIVFLRLPGSAGHQGDQNRRKSRYDSSTAGSKAKSIWIATNRHDLSGEDIAMIYNLHGNIESFFV